MKFECKWELLLHKVKLELQVDLFLVQVLVDLDNVGIYKLPSYLSDQRHRYGQLVSRDFIWC